MSSPWSAFWWSWRVCVRRRCSRPSRQRKAWALSTMRTWSATSAAHRRERTATRWFSVTSAMSVFIRSAIMDLSSSHFFVCAQLWSCMHCMLLAFGVLCRFLQNKKATEYMNCTKVHIEQFFHKYFPWQPEAGGALLCLSHGDRILIIVSAQLALTHYHSLQTAPAYLLLWHRMEEVSHNCRTDLILICHLQFL